MAYTQRGHEFLNTDHFWYGQAKGLDGILSFLIWCIVKIFKDVDTCRLILHNILGRIRTKKQIFYGLYQCNNGLEFMVCGCFRLNCRLICWVVWV